jgi:hypothetical protein
MIPPESGEPDVSVICRCCDTLVGGVEAGARVRWTICERCNREPPRWARRFILVTLLPWYMRLGEMPMWRDEWRNL